MTRLQEYVERIAELRRLRCSESDKVFEHQPEVKTLRNLTRGYLEALEGPEVKALVDAAKKAYGLCGKAFCKANNERAAREFSRPFKTRNVNCAACDILGAALAPFEVTP